MKIIPTLLTALFYHCFYAAIAQSSHSLSTTDGRQLDFLDPSFGNSGVSIVTPDGLYHFFIHATTLVQANGDLVSVGFINKDSLFNFQIALFRTDENGLLDSSFGSNGWVFTDIPGSVEIRSAVLQADDKILVTGSVINGTSRDVILVRYTTDGIPDAAFGNAGVVQTDVNGNLDYSFGLTADETGTIFVAGKTVSGTQADILVISYDQNGDLRPSFGLNGKSIFDAGSTEESAAGVYVQTADRIIIGGESAGNFLLVGFKASAELDSTFGLNGITSITLGTLSTETTSDFLNDDTGQLYLVGTTNATIADGKKSFVAARFDANGFPDLSYGINGLVQADVCSGKDDVAQEAALTANDELILTGYSGNAGDYSISTLALTSAGEINQALGELGVLLTDFNMTQDVAQDILVQQDGKIVVSGYTMDSSGCSGFQVRYDPAKYLQAATSIQTIRVYPNPAVTDLFLEITGINESATVFIYNAQGQLINEYRFSESQHCQIDLREFENGSYHLLIPQVNLSRQFMVITN